MREKKDEESRGVARQADHKPPPAFHDDPGARYTALHELRKYPFFADDDAVFDNTVRSTIQQNDAGSLPPSEAQQAVSEVDTIAVAHEQLRSAVDITPAAVPQYTLPDVQSQAEPQRWVDTAPATAPQYTSQDNTTQSLIFAAAERGTRTSPGEDRILARAPWYSRAPTGTTLFLVILYFTLGGTALIGTGLVLGDIGGTLMVLFGLIIAMIAGSFAWRELMSGNL